SYIVITNEVQRTVAETEAIPESPGGMGTGRNFISRIHTSSSVDPATPLISKANAITAPYWTSIRFRTWLKRGYRARAQQATPRQVSQSRVVITSEVQNASKG